MVSPYINLKELDIFSFTFQHAFVKKKKNIISIWTILKASTEFAITPLHPMPWLLGFETDGTTAPQPGIEPTFPTPEDEDPTTELPGKSQMHVFNTWDTNTFQKSLFILCFILSFLFNIAKWLSPNCSEHCGVFLQFFFFLVCVAAPVTFLIVLISYFSDFKLSKV